MLKFDFCGTFVLIYGLQQPQYHGKLTLTNFEVVTMLDLVIALVVMDDTYFGPHLYEKWWPIL